MAHINQLILSGHLTHDPERRVTATGMTVARFGLAINHRYRPQGGEVKEETCFVDVIAFGRQAETLSAALSKGSPVLVEGRLRFATWEDQAGQRHSKHEVLARRVHFLGTRPTARPGAEDDPGDLDDAIPF
ncbi:MAG: single-stranded DNA-binding protein [Candidatus Tectimicrobiota bacterium]